MGRASNRTKKTKQSHPLCVGFDPDTTDLHPFLEKQFRSTPLESFLVRWYQATISKLEDSARYIKLQSAFFEQFGPAGMISLRDIIIDAKRRGLYVILDAKRGDISSTMAAYGRTAFDQYQADALTILPWLGTDSLEALVPWLKDGKRVYIVWLSSNKSGRNLQLQPAPRKNQPIALVVYEQFTKFAKKAGVLDQLGWVLGATDLASNILKELPRRPHHFLLPGVGAQGATFDKHSCQLLQQHPESLFPISRGLLKPAKNADIETWDDYATMVHNNWTRFLNDWSDATDK